MSTFSVSAFFRPVLVVFVLAVLSLGLLGCSQNPPPLTPPPAATTDKPLPPAAANTINKGGATKAGEDWVRQHAPGK